MSAARPLKCSLTTALVKWRRWRQTQFRLRLTSRSFSREPPGWSLSRAGPPSTIAPATTRIPSRNKQSFPAHGNTRVPRCPNTSTSCCIGTQKTATRVTAGSAMAATRLKALPCCRSGNRWEPGSAIDPIQHRGFAILRRARSGHGFRLSRFDHRSPMQRAIALSVTLNLRATPYRHEPERLDQAVVAAWAILATIPFDLPRASVSVGLFDIFVRIAKHAGAGDRY